MIDIPCFRHTPSTAHTANAAGMLRGGRGQACPGYPRVGRATPSQKTAPQGGDRTEASFRYMLPGLVNGKLKIQVLSFARPCAPSSAHDHEDVLRTRTNSLNISVMAEPGKGLDKLSLSPLLAVGCGGRTTPCGPSRPSPSLAHAQGHSSTLSFFRNAPDFPIGHEAWVAEPFTFLTVKTDAQVHFIGHRCHANVSMAQTAAIETEARTCQTS